MMPEIIYRSNLYDTTDHANDNVKRDLVYYIENDKVIRQ